jgi:hypothetical protein
MFKHIAAPVGFAFEQNHVLEHVIRSGIVQRWSAKQQAEVIVPIGRIMKKKEWAVVDIVDV